MDAVRAALHISLSLSFSHLLSFSFIVCNDKESDAYRVAVDSPTR